MENPERQGIKPKQAVAYSALTLALMLFIVQSGFGMIVNILKNIAIYAKLKTVTKEYKEAERINKNLNSELTSFNTSKSLESIARNNLKMSGPDEILLIINVEDLEEENIDKVTKEKNISRRKI
ncbi:MAG: septum formation initiator family protein [Candidatus Gastranaerophilaceae bacterium]